MRALLLALVLVLPACGAGGEIQKFFSPTVIQVRVVTSLPNGWVGRFHSEGGDSFLDIHVDILESSILLRTVVHELGHSMGLEHGPDPACSMYETNISGGNWGICPQEVAAAAAARTSRLTVEAPLLAATTEAALQWNVALGRTQFTITP